MDMLQIFCIVVISICQMFQIDNREPGLYHFTYINMSLLFVIIRTLQFKSDVDELSRSHEERTPIIPSLLSSDSVHKVEPSEL